MKLFWIIGCGRFGKLALQRLLTQDGEKKFLVADPDTTGLPEESENIKTINADGVFYLKQHLSPQNAPDWIIPALPLHLAALWCITEPENKTITACKQSQGIENLVPNPILGKTGDIYTSMADFLCPDNCPEPAGYCPTTGKKREKNLFDLLEKIQTPGFKIHVIRSHQLAPGVGGYKPEQLFRLKQDIANSPGRHLIATACRCHGVITPVISVPAQQNHP